jgi:acyl transferase domain-containing protein/acyl carrier protein
MADFSDPIHIADPLDIAIVGMAGRFPGANNIDQFWLNLRDGVESIRLLTEQELRAAGATSDPQRDSQYIRVAGRVEDFDCFDASFFGYTPREAEIMDPQHRLLLECAWEALENAGYDPERYPRPIGVFAGAAINTYLLLNISTNPELVSSLDDIQINTTNGSDFLTTKISYKLNLKGPSHTIQCACSTSLTAVHIAAQSLLNEECDMAMAGGVAINVKLLNGYRYLPGGIMSPDGHCRPFDEQAQGTVFASGVGVVVLKRIADAIADRDCIHSVIKGSALNNDGALKVGYAAPSVEGQAAVIAEALANAGASAESITYVETHGTGTPLGDPVEIQALTKAFRSTTDKNGFCAIGSVKSNVGHLDAAAGVTSLIKATLALKHKLIPPSLNFHRPNPKIDFLNSPFFVADKLTPWPSSSSPRRAGVSSFGVGGTNAHLILEEVPPLEPSSPSRPFLLLPISAKTDSALEAATDNLRAYLRKNPEANLADVAYTLSVGRRAFAHRRFVVCRELEEAASALEGSDTQRVFTGLHQSDDRPVIFMFPGQGAQYVNAGSGLYLEEPAFRQEVDRCCKILGPYLGVDLSDILYPAAEATETAASELNQTWVTQPALFVTEYALAKLLIAWGVTPLSMIGHSIGEYVAACLAGVFSLEEALSLVSARGRLMQETPHGAMAAVALSEEEVRPRLGDRLSLAAINGPTQCVISGSVEAIEEFEASLGQSGRSCRRLPTTRAFHSYLMDSIVERFAERVRRVSLHPPQLPFISNVTGTWTTPEDAQNPEYWAKQLRQTVRFDMGLRELLKETSNILLEVGPGQTLSRIAKQHIDNSSSRSALSSLPDRTAATSDSAFLLTTLGKLWIAGAKTDWNKFYTGERRHRVCLPAYPFERERYWIDPQTRVETAAITATQQSVREPNIANWFFLPSWKRTAGCGPASRQKSEGEKRRWLMLLDEHGVGASLAERLIDEGHEVVTLLPGNEFRESGERKYIINPEAVPDYGALVKELREKAIFPNEIIHLWSLAANGRPPAGSESFIQTQQLGFSSLLSLSKAIGDEDFSGPLRITVISNGVCCLPGDQSLLPEKATILGPCKIIPQEDSRITCRYIDIVVAESGTRMQKRLIDQILVELKFGPLDPITAYRANQRWVQIFEPVKIESESGKEPVLREHGTYLIAGGLEGIGLSIAEFLAKSLAPNLVLIDTTQLPARGHWEQWLASHHGPDQISRKIRHALTLEELGAKISVIHADITDVRQIESIVEQVNGQFGKTHGVIYTEGKAGNTLSGTIHEVSPGDCNRLLQSRFNVLYAFDQALHKNEVDFCLLFSSLASIMGGIGNVLLASASLLMDAFAISRNKDGNQLWMSVNLDGWRSDQENEQAAVANEGVTEEILTPEEGIEAFKRLLSPIGIDQLIVSTTDLRARLDRRINADLPRASKKQHAKNASISRHQRPPLQNPYVPPGNELERAIANIWQSALGIAEVGVCDNFFDLGGESLIAVTVISQLKSELNLEVPVVSLYEGLTIRLLADLISQDKTSSNPDQNSIQAEELERISTIRKKYQQKQRSRRSMAVGEEHE